MKNHYYNHSGLELLETKEEEPECGKDFCDSCGDCLHCYWEDPCYENDQKDHFWVTYEKL